MDIKVYIKGNAEEEHYTYVSNEQGQCYEFYTDGYEGTSSEEIISFLEFIGHEVFVVHNDNFEPNEVVN